MKANRIARYRTTTGARATVGFALMLAFCLVPQSLFAESRAMRAAMFAGSLPIPYDSVAKDVADEVSAAGYEVTFIDATALVGSSDSNLRRYDLLVLPAARSLPALAVASIENYLKRGGDLLALGLPAWESPTFEIDNRWMTRSEYERALATTRPQHMLFDFAKTDVNQWTSASDDAGSSVRHEIVAAERGKALHVLIERQPGWETFVSPPQIDAFPSGHTLTCFRAKGGPHTRQLAVEWTERDRSRWIATIGLTTEWKDYALPPEVFKAWQPPPERAGEGDRLHVENAARFSVGVAESHTALEGDRHEYWIAEVGTAPNPFDNVHVPAEFSPPQIEFLSPSYLFFPIGSNPKSSLMIETVVEAADSTKNGEGFLRHIQSQHAASSMYALHPRPRGVGFKQDRACRWQPLLAVRDAVGGAYRGAIAALVVHAKPPYRGGAWTVFTPTGSEFYRHPVVAKCLRQTLSRMRRGIFLVEGGAEFFTVFPHQSFDIGAGLINTGNQTVNNLTVTVEATNERGRPTRVLKRATLALAAGATATVGDRGSLKSDDERSVRVVLRDNGKTIDTLSHEIGVWQPRSKPDFVEARDGGFRLGGQPWKAHGVNYMPSSGIGLGNWRHFEHWVGRGAYDPEVIERDLQRIQAMNLNAVSVFVYYESLGAQHILDFLRRCEAHGLKVNLSLRPGTPLDFHWDEVREMIEKLRLAQNDTVFAYDLAWEPHHDPQTLRSDFAEPWRAWVVKHYGSAEAAQKAWTTDAANPQFKLDESQVFPAPPIEWFTNDGPWRRLIADYRKFLDDMLGEKYAEARRLVKSIDPHHAVSFRMQHAGDPTYNGKQFLAYDFAGFTNAVDIWEPEAYGRIGDWEQVKPGRFTASYARLCNAAKPVLWAEMGSSVWDNLSMSPAAAKLDFQAQYYRDFYRMMNDSGADGVFFWWYPGGYRLNEHSDFGVIAPDGTDRPVTKVIREEGAKFLAAKKTAIQPDYWITIDRDRDARGLFGIYEAATAEYWQAIAKGKSPGLKWATATQR